MGTIEIKSKTLRGIGDYTNAELGMFITVDYSKNGVGGKWIGITGAVWTPDKEGTMIGNFYGNMLNDEMQYNFNNIKDISKMADLVTCINEIIQLIDEEV